MNNEKLNRFIIICLSSMIYILCSGGIIMAYPGKYAGSRIIGGGGICAVYSESARSSENEAGITHYYVGNYENDYISYCLPIFKCQNQFENIFGSSPKKRNLKSIRLSAGNFYVETSFKSILNTNIEYEYKVFSMPNGLICYDITIINNGNESCEIGVKPEIKFREEYARIQKSDNCNIFIFKNLKIGIGFSGQAAELLQTKKIGKGEKFNTQFYVLANKEIIEKNIDFSAAEKEWNIWLQKGKLPSISNLDLKKAYESCLIAIAATSLNGAVPADMTGQFLTDGKPQLYPRDALMTARALMESGYYGIAEEIINFWNKSIPQKSKGEWYARYDAMKRATKGGAGAAFDEPEWDSNGYYASLLLRFYQKTGRWIGDYELMKSLMDFVVSKQNSDGLVEEGGIIEWTGLLPATNMNLIAGFQHAALVCDLHNDNDKAEEYRKAAEKMDSGLKILFSKTRGAYMDVRKNKEQFNSSALFGFIWGYPDHLELALTNEWYKNHAEKLDGGVQYFEAKGYGSDLFGFTTGASAQYNLYSGDNDRYKKHIEWMMEHSNIYGMMPERIFYPKGQDVSPASPLSWCNGEFAQSVLLSSFLNNSLTVTNEKLSLEYLFDECEGLNKIINNKKFKEAILMSKSAGDFYDKMLGIFNALESIKNIENIKFLSNRIYAALNRIILNSSKNILNINTDSQYVYIDEPLKVNIGCDMNSEITINDVIVNYIDGNIEKKIGRISLNKQGKFEEIMQIRYTKKVPAYESGLQVQAIGRWKAIPVTLTKTIPIKVYNKGDMIQQNTDSIIEEELEEGGIDLAAKNIIQLNDDWQFITDKDNIGKTKNWQEMQDGDWQIIQAAKSWEEQGYDGYDGYAWYRKEIEIPAGWSKYPVSLIAEGVDDEYELYINGKFVIQHGKEHSVWNEKTKTDIEKFLKFGQKNIIILRVNDTGGGGGIVKNIYLRHLLPLSECKLFFEPACANGRVILRCEAKGAKNVFIAGSFNNWGDNENGKVTNEKHQFQKIGDGLFEKKIKLNPGRYSYKVVLDNYNWLAPESLEYDNDKNSVFYVTDDMFVVGVNPNKHKPHHSFNDLPFSNGLSAFKYNAASQRIDSFKDHIYSYKNENTPSKNILKYLTFTLKLHGKTYDLSSEPIDKVQYISGTGIVKIIRIIDSVKIEEYYFSTFTKDENILYAVIKVDSDDFEIIPEYELNETPQIYSDSRKAGKSYSFALSLQDIKFNDEPLKLLEREIDWWNNWQKKTIIPADMKDEEKEVFLQSTVVLKMAQCREKGRSYGQILASLPPGHWNIAWIRDASYAINGLTLSGHSREAQDALKFFLNAKCGKYEKFKVDGKEVGIGAPYQISTCRYFGDGTEESDGGDDPNIELDGFGLFLWSLGLYAEKTNNFKIIDEYWNKIKNEIADIIILNIDKKYNILRKDSSIWERHIRNNGAKYYTYSTITAIKGLEEFIKLCQKRNEPEIGKYESAMKNLKIGFASNQIDAVQNTVKGFAESSDISKYMDASVVEAINFELIDKKLAFGTINAFDNYIKMPTRQFGYFRNMDGSDYDVQEWIVLDLRIASALRKIGLEKRAAALANWVTMQSSKNYNLIAELYTVDNADYSGAIPMCGFGPGAYIMYFTGN